MSSRSVCQDICLSLVAALGDGGALREGRRPMLGQTLPDASKAGWEEHKMFTIYKACSRSRLHRSLKATLPGKCHVCWEIRSVGLQDVRWLPRGPTAQTAAALRTHVTPTSDAQVACLPFPCAGGPGSGSQRVLSSPERSTLAGSTGPHFSRSGHDPGGGSETEATCTDSGDFRINSDFPPW